MRRYGENVNGTNVALGVGEEFEICLNENRTTGFRWVTINPGEPCCELIRESTVSPPGPPGVAGTHLWQFRGAKTGAGTIEMHYRRAWEMHPEPGLVFRIQVEVASEGATIARAS